MSESFEVPAPDPVADMPNAVTITDLRPKKTVTATDSGIRISDEQGWPKLGHLPQHDDCIARSEFLAVLRMLVRRATLLDKWRSRRIAGHWLNWARREILIG